MICCFHADYVTFPSCLGILPSKNKSVKSSQTQVKAKSAIKSTIIIRETQWKNQIKNLKLLISPASSDVFCCSCVFLLHG